MTITGTPITTETVPVSISDMKDHLRVTHTDEDSYIEALILAAAKMCENFQNRRYMQTAKIEKLDEFPDNGIIRPGWAPLIQVDSIQYVDVDGNTQTVSVSVYDVDTDMEPGRITPAYNETWPSTRPEINAVTINYQAGYATADEVPDEIKHAIKLLVGHFYEHRESVSEVKLQEIPQGIQNLLWPGRIF